jgi:hypothetical protein
MAPFAINSGAGRLRPAGAAADPADGVVDRALAILEENSRGWLDQQRERYPEAADRSPEVGHDL